MNMMGPPMKATCLWVVQPNYDIYDPKRKKKKPIIKHSLAHLIIGPCVTNSKGGSHFLDGPFA